MGYSSGFLQGILSLWIIAASGALAAAGANELLGLGLFEDGYPGPGAASGAGTGVGFGTFAIRCLVVIGTALALSVLVERFNRNG